jgi:hypothetical protein
MASACCGSHPLFIYYFYFIIRGARVHMLANTHETLPSHSHIKPLLHVILGPVWLATPAPWSTCSFSYSPASIYSIILWVSDLKQVSECPPHPSKKLASAALLQNIYIHKYVYISIGGHNTILLYITSTIKYKCTYHYRTTPPGSFRWFIVAESTVRWFVMREKHCWMAADSADPAKRTEWKRIPWTTISKQVFELGTSPCRFNYSLWHVAAAVPIIILHGCSKYYSGNIPILSVCSIVGQCLTLAAGPFWILDSALHPDSQSFTCTWASFRYTQKVKIFSLFPSHQSLDPYMK